MKIEPFQWPFNENMNWKSGPVFTSGGFEPPLGMGQFKWIAKVYLHFVAEHSITVIYWPINVELDYYMYVLNGYWENGYKWTEIQDYFPTIFQVIVMRWRIDMSSLTAFEKGFNK